MLSKLRQWLRFRRYDDAYATTNDKLWMTLHESLQRQLNAGRAVWLVTHFPDSFASVQDRLTDWQMQYDVVERILSPESLLDESDGTLAGSGSIQLVLSALIPEIEFSRSRNFEGQLSVFVVERHPLIDHDQRIQSYCKRLGIAVELGYFQSFEDPIVAAELSEMTLMLMEQMGLNDHSLINSMTLTRRIDRRLKRDRDRFSSDEMADNLEEWYSLNQRHD